MADLNEVRLIGRLTRDPELRATQTGTQLCQFGLATSRKFKGNDGTMQEEVLFVDVTAWGTVAVNVHKYMKKGSQLFVGGRMRLEQWQDKTTGEKKSKISVVAENVQFLDRKEEEENKPNTEPISPSAFPIATAPKPVQKTQQPNGKNWSPEWSEPELGEPPF